MTDALMLACTLSRWQGDPRCCRWCDAELKGRRRRWCSDECGDEAACNHWWNAARHRALKRDGFTCVRCGPSAKQHGAGRGGLQVHHRDERAHGRHSQTSCCHHIDGLETLCHVHHVDEHTTTAEGRRRRARRAMQAAQMRIGDAA